MNAMSASPPETLEERTARQLRMCRDLAELGMDMARAAARRFHQNSSNQNPTTHEAATPDPSFAQDPASEGAAQAKKARKPTDPGLLFIRLSSAVRQTIMLEARIIAAGAAPDPRRAASHHATKPAEISREPIAGPDHQPAQAPKTPPRITDLVAQIYKTLGVPVPTASQSRDWAQQALLAETTRLPFRQAAQTAAAYPLGCAPTDENAVGCSTATHRMSVKFGREPAG